LSDSDRLATRAFVGDVARALEARLEAERKALDFCRAELVEDPWDIDDDLQSDRVLALLRGIQRADDIYDRAIAEASYAFRDRLTRQDPDPEPGSGHEHSEAYAGSVLDGTREAFIAMDGGGFVIDWNAASERTFGWSREEAVGRTLSDLIIPEDFREAHLRGLQRFLDTGTAKALNRPLELLALRRDGSEFPIELTISMLPGPGVPRFFAFVREMALGPGPGAVVE
jgi:PAS domain S-box-containing protein